MKPCSPRSAPKRLGETASLALCEGVMFYVWSWICLHYSNSFYGLNIFVQYSNILYLTLIWWKYFNNIMFFTYHLKKVNNYPSKPQPHNAHYVVMVDVLMRNETSTLTQGWMPHFVMFYNSLIYYNLFACLWCSILKPTYKIYSLCRRSIIMVSNILLSSDLFKIYTQILSHESTHIRFAPPTQRAHISLFSTLP